MAVRIMHGIPQMISFKRYTMCGPLCYRFTKYVVFPMVVKGLNTY